MNKNTGLLVSTATSICRILCDAQQTYFFHKSLSIFLPTSRKKGYTRCSLIFHILLTIAIFRSVSKGNKAGYVRFVEFTVYRCNPNKIADIHLLANPPRFIYEIREYSQLQLMQKKQKNTSGLPCISKYDVAFCYTVANITTSPYEKTCLIITNYQQWYTRIFVI